MQALQASSTIRASAPLVASLAPVRAEPLPNPELLWQPLRAARAIERDEIERRIGPFRGPASLRSGGLANSNLLVDGKVLRIYRRDASAVRVEHALLERPWRSFRVPRVFAKGEDFLRLEHVPHEPLLGDEARGRHVGRALAEIHEVHFEAAGFLGPELELANRFDDLVGALISHAVRVVRDPDDWTVRRPGGRADLAWELVARSLAARCAARRASARPGKCRGFPHMQRASRRLGRSLPQMGRPLRRLGRPRLHMGRSLLRMGRSLPQMGRPL